MDYEKAYKDALERARNYYKGLAPCRAKDELELIFHELAESEDEMALRIIRKRMCYDPVPISDEDRRIVENWLEKQKEQKPVDYDAELKKCKDNPLYFYDKYVKIKLKPSEWGEEDEKKRQRIIKVIEAADSDWVLQKAYGPYGDLINWLKSLHPQQKQEWSEEDEKNCNRIIRFLEPHKTFFPTKETKEEMQNWLKNRLKSLRPSWKPSEEQMEALERASTNKYLSAKQFDILVSLYEQLKKL